jgi:hypothetical protein
MLRALPVGRNTGKELTMLEAEQPTSDKVRTMEFKGSGGEKMYIRVQRWELARIVRVSFYDDTVKSIVFRTFGFEQYSEGLKGIAKKVGRELDRVM